MANRVLAGFCLEAGGSKTQRDPLRKVADTTKTVADRLSLADYYVKSDRSAKGGDPLLALEVNLPDGCRPPLLLAQVDYADRRRDQAHKRLDDLLSANPSDANVLLLKAQFLYTDGRLDDALSRAQAARRRNPRLLGAHYTARSDLPQKARLDLGAEGVQ